MKGRLLHPFVKGHFFPPFQPKPFGRITSFSLRKRDRGEQSQLFFQFFLARVGFACCAFLP